jgi:hypothetical protein
MNNTQKIFFLIVLLVGIYYTQGSVEGFGGSTIKRYIFYVQENTGSEQQKANILSISDNMLIVKPKPDTIEIWDQFTIFNNNLANFNNNELPKYFYISKDGSKNETCTGSNCGAMTTGPPPFLYRLQFKDGYIQLSSNQGYLQWNKDKFVVTTDKSKATKFYQSTQ